MIKITSLELQQFYKNRTVIILGGGGFIGSNLAFTLQQYRSKIIIVDAFIHGTGENESNLKEINAELIKSDIKDVHNWKDAIEPTSIIFHCAAKNTHKWCNFHIVEDCNVNYYPQLAVAEVIRKLSPQIRFVYCSTRTVYKDVASAPLTEFSEIFPQDVYSLHSLASERLFQLLLHRNQIRILRLTNTYGPKQRLSGNEIGLIGELVVAALNNDFYQIYQNGFARRDINYIDDVVRGLLYIAMIDVMDYPIIHLGGDWVETRSIVECLNKITGWQRYSYVDSPLKSISPLAINRAVDILGWTPLVDLTTGMSRTINYFQSL